MVFHGTVPGGTGFLGTCEHGKIMVALATILRKLVAKATKIALNSPLRKIIPEFVAQNSSNL
jgi:hypothetical protein